MTRLIAIVCVGMIATTAAMAVPSIVEELAEGVYVVRDEDAANWGGGSMGVAHMNSAPYMAKKILDLSDLPEEVWEQAHEVRLSAYVGVHDYSWNDLPEANGLDEEFEVIVNGEVHTYATNCGVHVMARGDRSGHPEWYDFVIPKDEFVRGVNEIIFHKAEGDKTDDYFYVGINNGPSRGNSAVNFGAEGWQNDMLTIPGGNGEYMVRLYVITGHTSLEATWTPSATPALNDPAGVIDYAGAHGAELTGEGVRLAAGQSARVEWPPAALDRFRPARVDVQADGPVSFAWLNEAGVPLAAVEGLSQALEANRGERVSGVVLTATDVATIKGVTLSGTRNFHPRQAPIDMAPVVKLCAPMAPPKPVSCVIEGNTATLTSPSVRCTFSTDGKLRMTSLFNEYARTEMLRSPEDVLLFLVEVGETRYGGSQDFVCEEVTAIENGFVATLTLAEPALAAELTATVDDEGLRLGMVLSNAGDASVDFKVAFPHMAGLAASDEPADDYYFFPWGGGIIADRPAIMRRGYGDYEAIYQLMDIFSPAKGAGLYVRADDAEGWHKVLAMRKHVPGASEKYEDRSMMKVRDEYKWTNSLTQAVAGTAVAYEYQRRTREPGESFAPADAVIAGHPGDWHVAMQRYADWAHEVWDFRPYPSKLHTVRNMIAAGWGKDCLFVDGAYRTDIIEPNTDCIELMSWWDWSDIGPFGTPLDQIDTIMDAAQVRSWMRYIFPDPVTGELMWNNQPGDYKGYNERFGGLPAFREAIETYRELGADLVTLYTDPFRLVDSCELGKAHGEEWGVVGVDGEKTKSYLVWNPCHDLPAVREWVAEAMGRVMRETGADGIRLDEYGYRGVACHDETHEHTYAEFGVNQWNKAVSEATRMIHEEMDKIRPDLVLTTEMPAYDYMMQFVEGCITYDYRLQTCSLRPLECNAQRFYFRECKVYSLDHGGDDVRFHKKFWNAVESFGHYYPQNFYTILDQSEDAYWLGEAYPLLVTPGRADDVYVNRFSGDGKILYHLYNATGHTFEGIALGIGLRDGEHLFDLLGCTEVAPEMRNGLAYVSVYLGRDDVGCIAQLQRRLGVAREGDALSVRVAGEVAGLTLSVADVDGNELLAQAATAGANTLDLAQMEEGASPMCVKLLQGKALVDVAEVR